MFKRIVGLLVACMITMGAICPLVVVHADTISIDDINDWEPDKYKSFMKLFNLVSEGYEVTFEEGTTSDDIYAEFVNYRYNQLLSSGQATGIESEYQRAALAGSTMTVLKVSMSKGDLYNSVKYDYSTPNNTSPGPYDDALSRIADFQNIGIRTNMSVEESGVTCKTAYSVSPNSSIICTNSHTDVNGYVYGAFDFFTADLYGNNYYKTPQYPSSVFGYSSFQNEAGRTIYRRDCSFYVVPKVALLVPSPDSWLPYDYYSHNFSVSHDEIRYANSIDIAISGGIPPETHDLTYSWDNNNYSNTISAAPNGLGSYQEYGNGDVCFITPSSSGISGFTVNLGNSYDNVPVTYDEFLNGLSGYLRNVDIYIGDSWDTATKLTLGTPGFSITKPSGVVGVQVPTGDNPTIDLFPFIVTVINKIDSSNTSVVINKNDIPSDSYKPEPSSTPVPTEIVPPVDVSPTPTEGIIAYYPPNIPGNILIPIEDLFPTPTPEGEEGSFDSSLWSKSASLLYPEPSTSVQMRMLRDEVEDISEDTVAVDSPVAVAHDIIEAGSSFLGPIGEYIWYIVGFGIFVSIIVKLLHN